MLMLVGGLKPDRTFSTSDGDAQRQVSECLVEDLEAKFEWKAVKQRAE
jgi:hypothetical protein